MPLDINYDTVKITITHSSNHPVHFLLGGGFSEEQGKYIRAGFILDGFRSPFGVEKFGKNYIINIEKPNKIDNVAYNQWVQITQIEKLFQQFSEAETNKHYQFRQLIKD